MSSAELAWEEPIHYVWLGSYGSVIKVVCRSGPLMHGSGRLLYCLGPTIDTVDDIPRLAYAKL